MSIHPITIHLFLILISTFFFQLQSKIIRNLQQNINNDTPTILRVLANSQADSNLVNTSVKTTVTIPENFITSMNALLNQGVITSSKMNGTINPLQRYAILRNDPIGVLSSITSSTLVPVITKITTINNSSSYNNKTTQNNVTNVMNVNDVGSSTQQSTGRSILTFPQSVPYFIQPINFNSQLSQINYRLNSIPAQSNVQFNPYLTSNYENTPVRYSGFEQIYPQHQYHVYIPFGEYNSKKNQLSNKNLKANYQGLNAFSIPNTLSIEDYNPFSSKFNYEVIQQRKNQKNTPTKRRSINIDPTQISQISQLFIQKNEQDKGKMEQIPKPVLTFPSSGILKPQQQSAKEKANLTTDTNKTIINNNKITQSNNLNFATNQNSLTNSIGRTANNTDANSIAFQNNGLQIVPVYTQNPANKAIATNIITNIVTQVIPTLTLYGMQATSGPIIPQYSNTKQEKNYTINLSNQSQTINSNQKQNQNLDSNGLTNGQADFSIKLEQLAKSSSNDIKLNSNSQTLSNIETVSQTTSVLSIFTNKNAQNILSFNSNSSENRPPEPLNQMPSSRLKPSAQILSPSSSPFNSISLTKISQNPIKKSLPTVVSPQPLFNKKSKVWESKKVLEQIKMDYGIYLGTYKPDQQYVNSPQKFQYRSQIFAKNLQKINLHNQKQSSTYSMGLNQFTDIMEEQFQSQKLSQKQFSIPEEILSIVRVEKALSKNTKNEQFYTSPQDTIVDWSCYASEVIYEGICSSSYAIAPLEAISITSRANKIPVSYLSIEQIIWCGKNNRTINGCGGGYFSGPFSYVKYFGVGQTSLYYFSDQSRNKKQSDCNYQIIKNEDYLKNKVYIKNSKRIRYKDCHQVVKQLKKTAISVAIAANQLQFYQSGTFSTRDQIINHGVTLVGYDPVRKYLIKNSWGPKWGMNGFAYVSQSAGVCNYAMYPEMLIQNQKLQDCR